MINHVMGHNDIPVYGQIEYHQCSDQHPNQSHPTGVPDRDRQQQFEQTGNEYDLFGPGKEVGIIGNKKIVPNEVSGTSGE